MLSLLEDLSIDFPSHFILSLIDVYRDTATCDKLIFPSAITQILCPFFVSYPESPHFSMMRIARRQAVMGGFVIASSPSPSASEDESDDGSDSDDADEDDGASLPSDDEMST